MSSAPRPPHGFDSSELSCRAAPHLDGLHQALPKLAGFSRRRVAGISEERAGLEAVDPNVALVSTATTAQNEVQPPPAPPRGRVLVVDDEAPIRRVLIRTLSSEHEVIAVGSAREARDLLERDRAFDLILCDLMMPDMTGMELHAWLNGADASLAQRLVFCSGGAFTPHASAYLERVGNPRLDKPFDHHQLRALVSQRVTLAPGRATAR